MHLADEHIDVIHVLTDKICEVLNQNVQLTHVLASTSGATGWYRGNWDGWFRNNGDVGAILEDDAIAAGIIGEVALELVNRELIVAGGIADSLLGNLSLLAAAVALVAAATVAVPLSATAAIHAPVVPIVSVYTAARSLSADLEERAVLDHDWGSSLVA